MKIHVCNDNKVFPFLYVDNRYTPEEEKLIWKELDFYTNPSALHRAEEGNKVGRYRDGTAKSNSWRIYVNSMYSEKGVPVSHILRLHSSYGELPEELRKAAFETGPPFRMFSMANCSMTYINYYENNDYYESHPDNFMISSISWFHREPKAYTGGNIIFNDIDITLECKHNRMLIFPSYYLHEVQPIKMKDQNLEMGWGRYAIQSFHTSSPHFLNLQNKDKK